MTLATTCRLGVGVEQMLQPGRPRLGRPTHEEHRALAHGLDSFEAGGIAEHGAVRVGVRRPLSGRTGSVPIGRVRSRGHQIRTRQDVWLQESRAESTPPAAVAQGLGRKLRLLSRPEAAPLLETGRHSGNRS